MMLKQLLPDLPDLPEIEVQGLQADSRAIREGDAFVAVPGETVDGRRYIEDAVRNKARLVLAESPAPQVEVGIPVIEVPELRSRLGNLAAEFYGNPSQAMLTVGVTGTNGKSSSCHFIAEALQLAGTDCGVIGTLGFGRPGHLAEAGLTTPPVVDLQRRLSLLHEDGCQAVALEASSHGLAQERLAGCDIDIAVFTNITRDHLDYHGDFARYRQEKLRLFRWPGLKLGIVNADDDSADAFASAVPAGAEVLRTSLRRGGGDLYVTGIQQDARGLRFRMTTPWGQGVVNTALLGRFNISNLLTAAAVLGHRGVPVDRICELLSGLTNVPGRMDVLREEGWATIVIDYAHTPDALEKALAAVKEHCRGEIWCVFGCGGDRDRGKRPMMGEVASRMASHVMITDDNPRGEKSRAIANDIVKGVVPGADVEVIVDRARAIRQVVNNAAEKDVVLIAGKGHEDYQLVGDARLPFSDHAVVMNIIGN